MPTEFILAALGALKKTPKERTSKVNFEKLSVADLEETKVENLDGYEVTSYSPKIFAGERIYSVPALREKFDIEQDQYKSAWKTRKEVESSAYSPSF